jgi:hypothetical protein
MMQSSVLISWLNRVFFFVAFLLLCVSVIEKIVNMTGYTLFRGYYTPGRLLEFAGIILLFVVALLLRTIRDELKSRR